MAGINETAYPRFKSIITENDLENVYTPTSQEILYANEVTRNQKNKVQFLIMLKSFQRLGYSINIVDVPDEIIKHIANIMGRDHEKFEFEKYDKSITRLRHLDFIRNF